MSTSPFFAAQPAAWASSMANRSLSPFDLPPNRMLGTAHAPISFYELGGERVYVVEPINGTARANMVFVHGLTEHAGRHFSTAHWLATLGYRILLFDLAGHGGRENAIDHSWWIYAAYAEGAGPSAVAQALRFRLPTATHRGEDFQETQFRSLARLSISTHFTQLDKVLRALQEARWNEGAPPLFLMGHSMGGLICAETAWRWSGTTNFNMQGVILLSPAFRPQGRPGRLVENQVIQAAWALRKLPFSLVRTAFKSALQLNFALDTTWAAEWMSDQTNEQELYRLDPLVPKAGPSAYAGSIEGQMAITEQRSEPFPADMLMLLPGRDGITSVEGGLAFAHKAETWLGPERFALVHFKELCAHDLMRSSARVETQRSIARWLEARVAALHSQH